MTSLEGITMDPGGGGDAAGFTIEEERRSNADGSTNDLSNLQHGAPEPENREGATQNGSAGDDQTQEAQSANDPLNEAEPHTVFLVKREEDLSITLIVAGLFSGVISACIVYGHSQLQNNSDTESAALLRVLLYKIGSAALEGEIPEVPRWIGPPPTVVAALVILYLSLGGTIGTVLLAMLAKRMLNIHAALGTSGEESETSRLGHWRFTGLVHAVIFILPIVLEASLLLLSCAVIVYVWKINLLIALFVFFPTLGLLLIHVLLLYPIEAIEWVLHNRRLVTRHTKKPA